MRHIPLRGWWRASCAARMVGPNLWQVWISRSVGEGSEGLKIWKLIKNQGRVVSLTYVLGPHGEFFSWCSRFLDSWGCWNTHKNPTKKGSIYGFPVQGIRLGPGYIPAYPLSLQGTQLSEKFLTFWTPKKNCWAFVDVFFPRIFRFQSVFAGVPSFQKTIFSLQKKGLWKGIKKTRLQRAAPIGFFPWP